MGRERADRGRRGGGDGIPPLRASGVRVGTALGALALLGGLCAYAIAIAPFEVRPLVGFPATGALLLVAVAAMTRWSDLLPWALALCLATYAAGLLAGRDALDPLAPAFAAGLLVAAELAYWSLESSAAPETQATLLRRAGVIAGLALATAALGSVLLAAAQVRPPGGPLVLAAGVAAAVASFVLLARFAHGPGR